MEYIQQLCKMKQVLPLLMFLLTAVNLFGQTSYSGFIGRYPIELVTDIYSDGDHGTDFRTVWFRLSFAFYGYGQCGLATLARNLFSTEAGFSIQRQF